MTAQGYGPIAKLCHGDEMCHPHRDDMPDDDSSDRDVPLQERPNESDVRSIGRGPDQVPAEAEWIGEQWNNDLPAVEEVGEIMRDMIGDRDREQAEDKPSAKNECPTPLAPGAGRHGLACRQVHHTKHRDEQYEADAAR